jgi:hypothetical protein
VRPERCEERKRTKKERGQQEKSLEKKGKETL